MPSAAAKTKQPVTWTLREASRDDVDGILACRKVTFPGEDPEKAEPAFWRWEFIDNHAGPARLFVAEDGGNIVGHYAVIPQRFLLDRELIPGSIVVDVMTHPDYRFQGMFAALGRYALERCSTDPRLEFTTGYPIRPEVIPGHLKAGWRIRFKIGTWVMPLSSGRIMAGLSPRIGTIRGLRTLLATAPDLGMALWAHLALRRRGGTVVSRTTRCDPALFGVFWQRLRENPPRHCMIQERTPEYLSWRFDANPGRDYVYHTAVGAGGHLIGWVVSRIATLLDVEAMILVDACVLPGTHRDVVRALVADVRKLAIEQRCPMLAVMVTQPNPFLGNLSSLGFVPTPHKFSFITRELAERTICSDDDLQWHLMWGDTDDI
jgi:GNAT superfamily N-acetyltransferase